MVLPNFWVIKMSNLHICPSKLVSKTGLWLAFPEVGKCALQVQMLGSSGGDMVDMSSEVVSSKCNHGNRDRRPVSLLSVIPAQPVLHQ